LITGRLIALIDRKEKKGRWGGGRARRESRGGAGSGGQREEEERKGGREADRRGPGVSVSVKKKKGEGKRWVGAGGGLGRLGRKGAGAVFFSLFLFQTPFSNQIHFKFKSNLSNFFPRIL
jgi:hypothetical protein